MEREKKTFWEPASHQSDEPKPPCRACKKNPPITGGKKKGKSGYKTGDVKKDGGQTETFPRQWFRRVIKESLTNGLVGGEKGFKQDLHRSIISRDPNPFRSGRAEVDTLGGDSHLPGDSRENRTS